MHSVPHFSFVRAAGVLVVLAAWLTLSNHCALATLGHGAATSPAAEVHKCCADKAPKGKEHAPAAPGGTCCKSLRVIPMDAAAKLVRAQEVVLLIVLTWAPAGEIPPVSAAAGEVRRAAGPPRAESFAERVLQRSLLSHAPPLAA